MKRTGKRLFVPLPGAHSIWANRSVMLAVADGKLYRISGTTPIEVGTIPGPKEQVHFVEADGMVYFGNRYGRGVYDPMTNQVRSWGAEIPNPPVLMPVSGNLDTGTYAVAYTFMDANGLHGPASQVAMVQIGDAESIELINRPAEAHVWVSDPDGDKLFYLGLYDKIDASYMGGSVLETLGYMTVPNLANLAHAYGRVWGSQDNRLWYSDPFRYDLFSPESYLEFDSEPLMVAPVFFGGEAGSANSTTGGIFVGFEDRTIFLAGADPKMMAQRHIGPGVVKGTLAYCHNVPKLGNNVPVWVAQDGIVAGTGGGSVVNLTNEKVKFAPGNAGASVGRTHNGEFQMISNFKRGNGSGMGFGDQTTAEVIRNGKVI